MYAKAAAFVVLLAASAAAQVRAPAIVGPSQIPRDKMARLSVDVPVGAAVIWDVSPDEVCDIEEVGGRLLLVGPPGRYVIKARVIRLEGATLQIQAARHVLVIGEGPSPVPPPIPPGPPPISPLAKALKDAAAKDGWQIGKFADLASAFQVCGNLNFAGRTAAQGEEARAASLKKNLPDGVPVNVNAVCSAKMGAVSTFLPISAPEHVVTADEAARVKAIYTELADACREAGQ